MLSIDQDKDFGLTVKPKESTWNGTLLLSFAIALLIHGTGLLLFRIQPTLCRQCEVALTPISVAMDPLLETEADVKANADHEVLAFAKLPQRPEVRPSPPVLGTWAPTLLTASSWPRYKVSVALPETGHPLSAKLKLTGLLAERKIVDGPKEVSRTFQTRQSRYQLTVDNRKGRVLWIEPLDSISEDLLSLQFEPVEGEIFTKGDLEVSLQ